jgi:hypothetical protein
MLERPKQPKLELDCELKLSVTKVDADPEPRYHFGAVINTIIFNGMTYSNEKQSSTSDHQIKSLAEQMAEHLVKKIAYAGGVTNLDFLNNLNCTPSLPANLSPNIAVCYYGKFRKKDDPNTNDDEKIKRAKELDGTNVNIKLNPEKWMFLLPEGSEDVKKFLFPNHPETNKVKDVPLTSFNKNSNLFSLQIPVGCKADQQLFNFANMIEGVVGENNESARQTNSANQRIPYSLTVAKIPNLVSECRSLLEAQASNTNKISIQREC